MMDDRSQTDVMRLLPLTVGLWLGYLLVLALIDLVFYPRPVFSPAFYLINGLSALVVLGLVIWQPGRTWLGKAFLPLVIVLLAFVPVVTANLAVLSQPPIAANGPEAVTLRLVPLLLMALILTAWQYGWPGVVFFSGTTALLTLGLQLFHFRPGGAPLMPPLTIVLIQTVTFLVVGYFISALIRRLQQQQASLARANAQLTDYAATLEDLTVSRERNRLARELHDTLAHTLSALSVQLETVKAYWEVDPATAQKMVDDALNLTRAGLQETRRALKSLRASPLDDLGLTLALRQLAAETADRANLRLEFSVPEQLPALPPAVEQCIYRVAQEATANVAHHARARRLGVQLIVAETVVLRVRDDGQGFDPRRMESAGHFGLPGMQERAKLIGGKLAIDSRPGEGTVVQLAIPNF